MDSLARILLLVLALAAAVVPGVHAAELASSPTGFVAGPALAADGVVVMAERMRSGGIRVLAVDPGGGRSVLQRFPASRRPYGHVSMTLAGTGGVVAGALHERVRKPAGRDTRWDSVITRALSLMPAVPLAECQQPLPGSPGFEIAAGTTFAATTIDCREQASSVVVWDPLGTRELRGAEPHGQVRSPRAAGGVVAWSSYHLPDPSSDVRVRATVARAATAEVLTDVPLPHGPEDLAVGDDGTAVALIPRFPPGGACGLDLFAASPGDEAPRRIPLPEALPTCPFPTAGEASHMSVAGGMVAYPVIGGIGITTLAGDARIIPVGARAPATGIALRGGTLLAVVRGCDRDRLLAVEIAGAPPEPQAGGTCPVERAGSSRRRASRAGRLTIPLRCPQGCRGTLEVLERRGHLERVAARARYSGAGPIVRVRLRLRRRARHAAGCGRGVLLRTRTHQPDRRGETVAADHGLVRVRARVRCRRQHGGGFLSFARPVPWP